MGKSKLNLPRSLVIELADEWIWNARNKEIFFLKLEGSTHEELAEKYNLSAQRVKEIYKECKNLIVEHSK
ncbi:MAG: hypothetical protein J6S67_00125 [Methanobrevibacter sp.]|nr:hypothetical protein [Methanobrevibacter sp.]